MSKNLISDAACYRHNDFRDASRLLKSPSNSGEKKRLGCILLGTCDFTFRYVGNVVVMVHSLRQPLDAPVN